MLLNSGVFCEHSKFNPATSRDKIRPKAVSRTPTVTHIPMFEQTFKNIDDLLYKDAGADSELDYIGQTSWVLFLRYLHDLEE